MWTLPLHEHSRPLLMKSVGSSKPCSAFGCLRLPGQRILPDVTDEISRKAQERGLNRRLCKRYSMKSSERYVFDTNVLVSALLFAQGKPGESLCIPPTSGQIITSLEMLIELAGVLSRPKFDRYLLREERERILQAFIHEAVLIEPTEHIDVCRDPKDNMVLELAVSGRAAHIVTGMTTCLYSTLSEASQLPRLTYSLPAFRQRRECKCRTRYLS